MKVYLTSSWRSRDRVASLAALLKSAGYEVRANVSDPFNGIDNHREVLDHCDVVVLIQPCGAAAHLDWAYAVGRGKTAITVGCSGLGIEHIPLWADAVLDHNEEVLEWLQSRDLDDLERLEVEATRMGKCMEARLRTLADRARQHDEEATTAALKSVGDALMQLALRITPSPSTPSTLLAYCPYCARLAPEILGHAAQCCGKEMQTIMRCACASQLCKQCVAKSTCAASWSRLVEALQPFLTVSTAQGRELREALQQHFPAQQWQVKEELECNQCGSFPARAGLLTSEDRAGDCCPASNLDDHDCDGVLQLLTADDHRFTTGNGS